MIKKIFKGIFLIIVIFILSAVIALLPINTGKNLHEGIGDNNDLTGIIDTVKLFKKSELKSLNSLIRETADETELNILVILGEMHMPTDEQGLDYCHDLYDSTFGEYTDGVLLYLDLAGYSGAIDVISTSGTAHIMYQKHIRDFFNAMYAHLPSSGEKVYPEAVSKAIKTFCNDLKQYKKEFEPSSFDYERDENAYVKTYTYYRGDKLYITTQKAPGLRFKIMLTASLIGTILALILFFSIKRNYKFKNSANPGIYVSRDETRFNEKSDTFIRRYTTKVIIPSGSGGSSRSGGGGGGGHSGSHGGGTGHR